MTKKEQESCIEDSGGTKLSRIGKEEIDTSLVAPGTSSSSKNIPNTGEGIKNTVPHQPCEEQKGREHKDANNKEEPISPGEITIVSAAAANNNTATTTTSGMKNAPGRRNETSTSIKMDGQQNRNGVTEKLITTSKEEKEGCAPAVIAPSSSLDRNKTDHVNREEGSSSSAKKDNEVSTLSTKESTIKDDEQEREEGQQLDKSGDKNGTPPCPSTPQDKKTEKIASSGIYNCRNEDQTSQLISTANAIASHDSPGERHHDDTMSSSSAEKTHNPYLNRTVRIISGQFEGLTGKIVQIHSRGWWTLDNPQMSGKNIHPRFCELVDDIEPSILEDFYKNRAKNRSLPSIVLRQIERAKRKRGEDDPPADEGQGRKRPAVSLEPQERRGQRPTRRAAASRKKSQDSSVSLAPNKKQKARNERGKNSASKVSFGKMKKVLITSSIEGSLRQHPFDQRDSHHKGASKIKNYVSPPFVLSSQEDNSKDHEALQHLPPNYKVEIFNRKNGRILKGKHAVPLKDLPSILMRHAEYEPIIPSPKCNSNSTPLGTNNNEEHVLSHEARSSINARINQDVQPQTRVRASAAEGCRVKITAGPYCGLTGKIESCIPGNWYLISELSKKNKFDFDYIVHSRHLEMLPKQREQSDKGGGKKKIKVKDPEESDHSLTLELKEAISTIRQTINSLEQKKILLKGDGNNKYQIVNDELKKLDHELKIARERLKTKSLSYQMLSGNE